MALALRDNAFSLLGIERIISLIQPGNFASIAVAERVGMQCKKVVNFHGKQVRVYAMRRRNDHDEH